MVPEAFRRGGAPSKVAASVLQMTKEILDKNAKPWTRVARVHEGPDGGHSEPKRRWCQEKEVIVPSQSLLRCPQQLWQENQELRKKLCRSHFYKLLKSHFAECRP